MNAVMKMCQIKIRDMSRMKRQPFRSRVFKQNIDDRVGHCRAERFSDVGFFSRVVDIVVVSWTGYGGRSVS